MKKQYADAETYERKLSTVMERMKAEDFNYNFDRHGAWVEFRLNGQLYRFEHTKEKAALKGIKLSYGSDCFAQIVLSLEDLARMSERGIYELQTWLEGLKFLPPPVKIPYCITALGFQKIPESIEEIKARFKGLAKKCHPDSGGSAKDFAELQENTKSAIDWFKNR